MNWNDTTVSSYEQRIPLKIPSYYTLYDMINHFLFTTLPKEHINPNLLVIGAGGGQEILSIGKQNSNLSFTGVDPSESMLQLAKKELKTKAYRTKFTSYTELSIHYYQIRYLTPLPVCLFFISSQLLRRKKSFFMKLVGA